MAKIIFLDVDGVLLPTTFARFLEQAGPLSRGVAVGHDDLIQRDEKWGLTTPELAPAPAALR